MTDEMIKSFDSTYKIALLATVDDEDFPHITMLSSLQASSPTQLIMGQFTEGLSKRFITQRPDTGFLIMSLDKRVWTGTARWTHKRNEGAEYDMYNKKPLFRYNTYFGIHTVHYFDLVEISEGENLEMGPIVFQAVLNLMLKKRYKNPGAPRILKPWAENLMKGIQTLKFLSWIADNGVPGILPVIEAQAADSRTIAVPAKPYAYKALNLVYGSPAAVMGMNLEMTGTLVKGTFGGFKNTLAGKRGALEIERVYNTLPPKAGYIYPGTINI